MDAISKPPRFAPAQFHRARNRSLNSFRGKWPSANMSHRAGINDAGKRRAMNITKDDLSGPAIAAFLEEHMRDMRSVSPPESTHALDLAGLRKPEITFWTVRQEGRIAGCCALKQLDPYHGEVKSMRTSHALRRRGIAARLLEHLIREASARGYHRLSLGLKLLESD